MINVIGNNKIGRRNDCFRLLLSLEKRLAPFFKKSAVSSAPSAFCLYVDFVLFFIVPLFLSKTVNFSLRCFGIAKVIVECVGLVMKGVNAVIFKVSCSTRLCLRIAQLL